MNKQENSNQDNPSPRGGRKNIERMTHASTETQRTNTNRYKDNSDLVLLIATIGLTICMKNIFSDLQMVEEPINILKAVTITLTI